MPLVEIKDFNALIDNKPFFDKPVRNKKEPCRKRIEMSRNNYYATRNLLDYLFHQIYYKRIGMDLLRLTNTSIPRQVNFTGKLEEDGDAVMSFATEKHQKLNCFKFYCRFIICHIIIMEQEKILNLLNEAKESKFATRKLNIVNDNSKSNYDATNEITHNTKILKSNLCDYNDAYILVTGDITVVAAPATQVLFKNCAIFTKYITKVD